MLRDESQFRPAMGETSGGEVRANDEDPSDGCTNSGRSFSEWPLPPDDLQLKGNEVHFWATCLDLPGHLISRCLAILTADEEERAGRYYFERDRNRFIAARVCLRSLLGAYLKINPDDLRFSYSEYGKPALANPANREEINFNLAHSGDLAVYGFTLGRQIGVDVEQIRPEYASYEVAHNYFSPSEVAKLGQLSHGRRQRAFFDCWTRKEAFIKGIGLGLSLGLDQFDVSLAPDEPAAVLRTAWDPLAALRWSLVPVEVMPGYVAAVAIEGNDWDLQLWQIPKEVLTEGAIS